MLICIEVCQYFFSQIYMVDSQALIDSKSDSILITFCKKIIFLNYSEIEKVMKEEIISKKNQQGKGKSRAGWPI